MLIMQTTLSFLKPDTLQRDLVGNVITRLENKWLKLVGLKMVQVSDALVEEHYDFLMDKPFFPNIKKYITSAPVICMAWKWENAVNVVRKLCWVTNPADAEAGTIRGDYGLTMEANIIHASDSEETAVKEVKRFFNENEIFDYAKITDGML